MSQMSVIVARDSVECPICEEIFRDPILLPCSHSFCSRCVQRLIHVASLCNPIAFSPSKSLTERKAESKLSNNHQKSDNGGGDVCASVTCPLCRALTAVPFGGILNLPRNLKLKELCETASVSLKNGENTTCQNECTAPATSDCEQCAVSLCESCCKAIHALPALRRHTMKPVGALRQEQASLRRAQCKAHPEERAKLVCQTCVGTPRVCLLCSHEPQHQGHKFITLEANALASKQTMAKSVQAFESLTSPLKKTCAQLNQRANVVAVETKKAIETVETQFTQLQAEVERIRESLLARLRSAQTVARCQADAAAQLFESSQALVRRVRPDKPTSSASPEQDLKYRQEIEMLSDQIKRVPSPLPVHRVAFQLDLPAVSDAISNRALLQLEGIFDLQESVVLDAHFQAGSNKCELSPDARSMTTIVAGAVGRLVEPLLPRRKFSVRINKGTNNGWASLFLFADPSIVPCSGFRHESAPNEKSELAWYTMDGKIAGLLCGAEVVVPAVKYAGAMPSCLLSLDRTPNALVLYMDEVEVHRVPLKPNDVRPFYVSVDIYHLTTQATLESPALPPLLVGSEGEDHEHGSVSLETDSRPSAPSFLLL